MKLSDVREAKDGYLRCKSRLDLLRELARSCPVPKIDGLPKPPGFGKSQVESFTADILEAERELSQARDRYLAAASRVGLAIIQRVKNLAQMKILLLRYVECRAWNAIIREVNLSDSQVFALHRRGLKAWRAGEIRRD